MQQFEINAEPRVDQGKGASRRLRRAGRVPGVLYGAGKNAEILSVSNNEMLLHLEKEAFYSHVLTLKLGSGSERVVLKDLQRHPFKPILMHIDLLRVDENKELFMRVPLHFVNEGICVGVKTGGGVLSHLLTDLEISCLPRNLPEFIEVDVAEMDLGDTLHVADLKLPNGVQAVTEIEQGVISCHLPKVVVEATPEESAAEAATEVAGPAASEKPAEPAK